MTETVTEAPEQPVQFTSLTPSGTEVLYQAAPRRLYKVRKHVTGGQAEWGTEWVEVPSVTTVLGVLDKPAMAWWGMKTGVQGVVELLNRNIIHPSAFRNGFAGSFNMLVDAAGGEVDAEDIVRFLTENKLTVNHVRDRAGDRGTSVHSAFEQWSVDGTIPHPEIYPAEEQGYIAGLRRFLLDWTDGCSEIESEVMVGSIEHGYAGRFDLRCLFNGGPVVTRTYPKKPNKVEEIPAARYLIDLKSSAGVYPSHSLQLAAYEGASVECGYEPTDYQAVVHVTKHGQYELVRTTATLDDFLSVRDTYSVMQKKMTV